MPAIQNAVVVTNFTRKLEKASSAIESLRKDVDVMAEWIERIFEYLEQAPQSSSEPVLETQR